MFLPANALASLINSIELVSFSVLISYKLQNTDETARMCFIIFLIATWMFFLNYDTLWKSQL